MSLIVQKFGGSSVADIEKINNIAAMVAEVKNQGHDVVVVVSAMGKTTNQLIEMAHNITQNPEKREMDMLLSTGERITMSLLCIALNNIGIDAVSLTGSQAGIITNDRHNDARVIEVRPFRVQDEIASGKVVVVGGFQGVSYKKDVTTLGRGGSDTSAVALAAALEAERCEIYSDIDGVYSTDPAVVKDAKHLPEISYQLMQEMAQAGAKVLNAEAVQFAKDANIAIYARSTFVKGRETIVRKLAPGQILGVKAVVYEKDLVRIVLHANIENFSWIINRLKELHVPIKELNFIKACSPGNPNSISFVVSLKNIYAWEALKEELEKRFGDNIHFELGIGAVSLIGDGINEDNFVLDETISLLQKANIEIDGVTTTSFRISFLLPLADVERSVQLAHERWKKMI
jgi:aspartate kinase